MKQTITGWGRYPMIDADVLSPQRAHLNAAWLAHNTEGDSWIPRGLGRSYGDSALANCVISTAQLDTMVQFNPDNGVLRCAGGVSLADILRIFVPRGWFLPVTPGTQFVTVGGAIASDVHGKNHHHSGCFSSFVDDIELWLPSGELLRCSREQHPELFRASCGGMGLTGLITQATLRLIPITSSQIEQTTIKTRHLDETLDCFAEHHANTYSVAWIDCLARGNRLGRSLVMLGEHAQQGGLSNSDKKRLSVPIDMPNGLLNPWSIRAFNTLYYHRIPNGKHHQQLHYQPYFYPLDSLQHWNRLYGKRGFTQYQFVLPTASSRQGMQAILKKIADSGQGSFLAVLKVFGEANQNYLSFPMAGSTLALDFKFNDGVRRLLDELDAMVLDYGGRIYLTKDVRMSASTFQASYPQWQAFQAVRAQYGLLDSLASLQSTRLGLSS